jgi:sterol desaturase/sphingolipid hydroxylase (fatty acid hydroxylase superfamily)
MHFDKIKNKGQARLFQSEYLEIMTKTHPLVIYSMYIPVIVFMLYFGVAYKGISWSTELIFFIAGILFWTFFEYIIHRYLFHFIAESPRMQKIVYRLHGVHHEFPRDKERLFMPPVPSMILACILTFTFYSLLGWNMLAFFPGFVFGYLIYGSMHYAIHAFAPPKFLKALWRNHHLHHYKSDEKGFGVSSVLWDIIFRTVPEKEEQTNIAARRQDNAA